MNLGGGSQFRKISNRQFAKSRNLKPQNKDFRKDGCGERAI